MAGDVGGERKSGTVARVGQDYGFITNAENPEQRLYFKVAWFTGAMPLREGEAVTFQVRTYGSQAQAHLVRRPNERVESRPLTAPTSDHLFAWAYLGYSAFAELRSLALEEDWEFKNSPRNPERPFPILYSYLLHTFGRLVLEKKVMVNPDAKIAAFNTGLVDRRYEPIYAMFEPNPDPRTPWALSGFCVAGEGLHGQNLVRHLAQLPTPAHYFDDAVDLLYDVRAGKPEAAWEHVIIDRIGRYPADFLDEHWPAGFQKRDVTGMSEEERKVYYRSLGQEIAKDSRIYRRMMNRFRDAMELSIKRVAWNYKTAIPTYYPRVNRLQLLLPVCLVADDVVDLALAVEKTPSGRYLGHTVLPLDWAYKNARLVCRPDSDWLSPAKITVEGDGEEEE
jgi:hypothetical protein